MKKEAPDHLTVQQYFDQIAEGYPERYRRRKSFHASFFTERLQVATRTYAFQDKTVWDIGAGTGALYDLISDRTADFEYYACDLSEKMLAQSRIPPERRQAGPPYWQQFPDRFFDYIFVLGVTSYLPKPVLAQWMPHLRRKLKPGGQLIISFTNAAAWEFSLRRRARPLIQRLARPDQLINQPFETLAYTYEEAIALFAPHFQLRKKHWLYTSLPGLGRFWPRLSTWLGRRLARRLHIPHQLSTDFLVVLEARG